MQETQITVTIKQDGQIVAEMGAGNGETTKKEYKRPEIEQMTEQEAEKYNIVSDLADVCEYLEESEVIKIRLIISKAQKRREREET